MTERLCSSSRLKGIVRCREPSFPPLTSEGIYVLLYFPILYTCQNLYCNPFVQWSFLWEIIVLLHSPCYTFDREKSLHLLSYIIIFTTMQWYVLIRGNIVWLISHLSYLELARSCAHFATQKPRMRETSSQYMSMTIAKSKKGGDESGANSKILHSYFIECKLVIHTWREGWDSSILPIVCKTISWMCEHNQCLAKWT